MKIGQLVRHHIPRIFEYCDARDPSEFRRLCDPPWSKGAFDINFPFCKPAEQITTQETARYWQDEHTVQGMRVRVTSQWFNPPTSDSHTLFLHYLEARGIPVVDVPTSASPTADIEAADACERAARGRYKGNAIGNAQNLLVRNILSRLGDEQFSEADWRRQIEAFGNRCAYCGAEGELLMDHVIPINKQALGEHRIGNLVPSCHACNAKKGSRDFREFLSHAPDRIAVIEAHMSKHDYAPLGDNEEARQIAELAHQELRHLADRYVAILNTVLRKDRGDS